MAEELTPAEARTQLARRCAEIEAQTAKHGPGWWPEGVAHAAALRTVLGALDAADRRIARLRFAAGETDEDPELVEIAGGRLDALKVATSPPPPGGRRFDPKAGARSKS